MGILLLLLAGSTLRLEAAPTPGDFAWQADIDTTGQSLQRVALPIELLLALTRNDLADIAVFNAMGNRLPHSVTRTPATREESAQELPFHEFTRFLESRAQTVTTREQSRDPETVTEREITETLALPTRRNDYLIELAPGGESLDLDRIELDWLHEPAGQLLEVRVEAGSDLDRLRVIQPRKSLAARGSADPAWRSLANVPRGETYLRLTPLAGVERFELLKATAVTHRIQPVPRLSWRLASEPRDDESGRYYRLVVPSAVRPAALRILPASGHEIVEGDLYGLEADAQRKHLLKRGFRQHRLSADGVVASEPIELPERGFSALQFTSTHDLEGRPQVELLYPRYEIDFLTDGNGPYRLAWGNYAVEQPSPGLEGLLAGDLREQLDGVRFAGLGPARASGGPQRLTPQSELPWKKWLLWAFLLAAALATGRMAWRLYRELNATDPA